MVETVFLRNSKHVAPPGFEIQRVLSALIHLAIPLFTYQIMYNDLGTELLSKVTTVTELSPERKSLYLFLNVFYAIRWASGMLTMNTQVSLGVGLFVAITHLLLHETSFIIFSMGFYGAPYDLTIRDYIAVGLMVLAGILQHGSEAQRWMFKLDPNNKGKLHTSGLFGMARGINHTGHILRDFGSCLLAPSPFLVLYLIADYDLAFSVFPATVKHTKNKYGKQYDAYAKQTPRLFIPGVY
jgi:steroid 5-alpha reductase family enzyme